MPVTMEMVSVDDLMAEYEVSRRTIGRMIKRGTLQPVARLGPKRAYMFDAKTARAEVERITATKQFRGWRKRREKAGKQDVTGEAR